MRGYAAASQVRGDRQRVGQLVRIAAGEEDRALSGPDARPPGAPTPWRRLTGHGARYAAAEAGSKAAIYLFLLLLARAMTPAEFGWVNLYIALASLLAVVLGLGLPAGLMRFHFGDFPAREVLGSGVVAVLVAGLAGAGVAALLGPVVLRHLDLPAPLLYLAVPGALVLALRHLWLADLRARGRSWSFLRQQAAEAALVIAAFGVAVLAGAGTSALVVGVCYSGGTALVALQGLARWTRSPGLAPTRRAARPLLAFSLPLVFHSFAMTGLVLFDQVVVNQLLGAAPTGVYSFAYRVAMVMMIVTTGLGAAWTPALFALLRARASRREVASLIHRQGGVVLASGAFLMLALPAIAVVLGGEGYREAAGLVVLVVYAYVWFGLYTLVLGFLLYAARTVTTAFTSIAVLAVNLGLNYLLIPVYGLAAAAASTVASYALLFGLQWRWAGPNAGGVRWGALAATALALAAPAALLYRLWMP